MIAKFTPEIHLHFFKKQQLRYDENTHQPAALYVKKNSIALMDTEATTITTARQLQGK